MYFVALIFILHNPIIFTYNFCVHVHVCMHVSVWVHACEVLRPTPQVSSFVSLLIFGDRVSHLELTTLA